jgi:anaerobic dimethyl sulfoxide reductase subunit B (iron-sulfur subunit)
MACQDWNDLIPGDGVHWRRVITVESGEYPNVRLSNQSLSCLHCSKPACETQCPAKAISKRAEDGIVIVDHAKCQGCRTCLQACPFGIPQYGPDGKMQICNFCMGKVHQEELPACAAACTGGALFAGPLDELSRTFSKRSPVRLAGGTEPSMLVPKART